MPFDARIILQVLLPSGISKWPAQPPPVTSHTALYNNAAQIKDVQV